MDGDVENPKVSLPNHRVLSGSIGEIELTEQMVSGLRQPSKIPPPGMGLHEMSASANNARAATLMPPPEARNLKHKGSALPEPTAKRQTLCDMAADSTPPVAPVPARQASSNVKGTTLVGSSLISMNSSTKLRTPSQRSQQTVTSSSFGKSVGSGVRPPSTKSHNRPQTSTGQNRPIPPSSSSRARPASSLDVFTEENERVKAGKRQGMHPPSVSTSSDSSPPQRFLGRRSRRPDAPLAHYKHNTHVKSRRPSPDVPEQHDDCKSPHPLHKDLRNFSLSTAIRGSTHNPWPCPTEKEGATMNSSPCSISRPPPLPVQIVPASPSWVPPRTPKTVKHTSSPQKLPFLTRDSRTQAWDTKGRLEDMEQLYTELREKMTGSTVERNGLEEAVEIYKSRTLELDAMRSQLTSANTSLQVELESTKQRLQTITATQEEERRRHAVELIASATRQDGDREKHNAELIAGTAALEDERRRHHAELMDIKNRHGDDLLAAKQQADDGLLQERRKHREDIDALERRLRNEVEDVDSRRSRELHELRAQSGLERQTLELEMGSKAQQVRSVEIELEQVQGDLTVEKSRSKSLQAQIAENQTQSVSLESCVRTLKARITFLESDCESQSESFRDLQKSLEDAEAAEQVAKAKLRKEETLRRKLHNQVQELKGNIRVFCRVRPSLESEPSVEQAKIAYPDAEVDSQEVEVMGAEEKSSLGTVSTKKNAFKFDRIFGPASQNQDVFEEISQLVQSALDGFNVCIFCYGQTGAGKTHTMSAEDGMIPRAVHQIYQTAKDLEEKGWSYTMEGSFVEVYNEQLNDLLGKADEFDKKKHEIRHDAQRCKTFVSDLTSVDLNSPSKVESILKRAMSNRSVAATKANERSSRSHSVFMLRMTGQNRLTGEKSEGTLNLVDLAGSERLSHSGSTGERLKETQNINRSLSCLGDVIGALGQGKEGGHVPYRNSKVDSLLHLHRQKRQALIFEISQLTYLLQYSLGGNSKTLMFVMISPLQTHLSETLTSLKFATKVHNTHIGTAKKQSKIRDT